MKKGFTPSLEGRVPPRGSSAFTTTPRVLSSFRNFFSSPRRSKTTTRSFSAGFTLIEMLVSVGIFTVVMVVALGALLAVSESDRKAQTIKTVTNNLSFALEGISRTLRTGIEYSCDSWTPGQDCTSGSGGSLITFQDINGNAVGYQRSTSASLCGQTSDGGVGCIVRSFNGGSTWEPITAAEVVIEHLSFYLLGSSRSDDIQPRVTISARGFIPVSGGAMARSDCNTAGITCSTFDLQTTVTQRLYDR